MIITCPECKSRFRLNIYEANAVKNQGRILQCGKCDHEWEQKRQMPPTLNNPKELKKKESLKRKLSDKSDEILQLKQLVTNKQTEEINFIDSIPLNLKIISLFLFFTTIMLFLINHKSTISYFFPGTKGFYQFIGIKNTQNIEIEKITLSKESVFNKEFLVLSGFIINTSDSLKYSPDLRITFLDKNFNVIKTIYSDLPNKELIPEDKSKISIKINQYPLDAHYLAFDIGNYLELLLR